MVLESLIRAERREGDTAQLQGGENSPEKLGHDTRDSYLPKKNIHRTPKNRDTPAAQLEQ